MTLNLGNTNARSVLEKGWRHDVCHTGLVPCSVHQVLTVPGPPFPLLLLPTARAATPMGSLQKQRVRLKQVMSFPAFPTPSTPDHPSPLSLVWGERGMPVTLLGQAQMGGFKHFQNIFPEDLARIADETF